MAKNKVKGFAVVCPMCGDREAVVRIDLGDLDVCSCSSCDEEFSPTQARDRAARQLAAWEAVVRWTEAAGSFLAE